MKNIESNTSSNCQESDKNPIQRTEGFHLYVGLIRKLAINIIMALCNTFVTTLLTVPICVILTIWIAPGIMGSQMDKIDAATLTVIVIIIAIWGIASSVVKAVWEFGTRDRANPN